MIDTAMSFIFLAVLLMTIGIVLWVLKKESLSLFMLVSAIVSSAVGFLIAIAVYMGVF